MAKKRNDKQKKTAGAGDNGQQRVVAENRKARHRFEILEQLECGVVLAGSEVKSLREARVSLDEAYIRVRDGELWLVGADIPPYPQATLWNHEPKRPRKLLVQARQLRKLAARTQEKGLTLIPLRVYFNARGLVKIQLAVGRGKKLHDKRDALKRADVRRDIDRAMRARR